MSMHIFEAPEIHVLMRMMHLSEVLIFELERLLSQKLVIIHIMGMIQLWMVPQFIFAFILLGLFHLKLISLQVEEHLCICSTGQCS